MHARNNTLNFFELRWKEPRDWCDEHFPMHVYRTYYYNSVKKVNRHRRLHDCCKLLEHVIRKTDNKQKKLCDWKPNERYEEKDRLSAPARGYELEWNKILRFMQHSTRLIVVFGVYLITSHESTFCYRLFRTFNKCAYRDANPRVILVYTGIFREKSFPTERLLPPPTVESFRNICCEIGNYAR